MSAACAEFNDAPSLCRPHYPRRLRRNHRLERDHGEQIGLDDLSFNDGRSDSQQWFLVEDRGAFRNCPHLAGKAKCPEIFEEFVADLPKNRLLAQELNIFCLKPQSLQIIQHLF